MKQLFLKTLFCCAFVLGGMSAQAQIIITSNTSSPQTCDGYAAFNDSIYDYTSAVWMQTNTTILSDTHYVTGLCPGTYSVTLSGSSVYGDTTITFTIGANPPCSGFSAYISYQQNATAGNCDGGLNSAIIGGIAPVTYSWNTGSTSNSVGNLCAYTSYTVTITDAIGCTATATGYIIGDTIVDNDPCSNFHAGFSYVQNPSTPGVCNGSIGVGVMNGALPFTYNWNTGSSGNSLDNVCAYTTYSVTVTDGNGCTRTISTMPVLDTIPGNPCNNSTLQAFVSVTPVSNQNLCDGSVIASASGGVAPYTYSWSNGATGTTLNNLCPATFELTVTDSLGCIAHAWAGIYGDTIWTDTSLVVYPYPTNTTEDDVCDGQLNVYASGGNAPYIYVLSNGMSNNTGYFDSLCQGIYTVTVYDLHGDTVYVDVIISNPSNNHNNPNEYGDSLYVDSVLSALQENCQINYQEIDSVYITYYTFIGDSVFVHWKVVTSSGSVFITQAYYLGSGAGVYSLGLQVYCPEKSLGNYFTATDYIYFNGIAGIKENTLGEVSVYPNPVADNLNIRFAETGDYQVALYDLMGREILSEQSNDTKQLTVNVSGLAQGQYTLKITGKNGTMSKSILK